MSEPTHEGTPPIPWRERARQSPCTAAIAAICVLLFAITLVASVAGSDTPLRVLGRSLWRIDDDAVLRGLGALDLTRVWLDGEWWRLLSTAFLHGSWIHLGLNLTALWSVGTWLERGIGPLRSALVFLVAAVGGSLASLAACEAPIVVGASGGILGLAGALLVARRWGSAGVRRAIAEVSAVSLGVMIALCIGLGAVVPVIAQAGHLGGLALGTCALLALSVDARWTHRALGVLGSGALLLAGTLASLHPEPRSNYPLFLAYRHLDDGDTTQALRHFELALERAPEDPSLANAVAYHLSLRGHELDRAEELVQRALAAEPENADYMDTLGWIECRRGHFDRGMPWLLRARDAADGSIDEIEEHILTCRESAVAPGE